MFLAGLGAIGQKICEYLHLFWQLGDRNIRHRNIHVEINRAQTKNLARGQYLFRDAFAIDETAIRRTNIAECDSQIGNVHFAMRARYARIGDDNVIGRVSPKAIQARSQIDCHTGMRTVSVD